MNKKDIRLVVLDLDGTYFHRHSRMSPYARETLSLLRENGIMVMINSGRALPNITGIIPPELFDYAASMNGLDLYIRKEDRHIRQSYLQKEDLAVLRKYPHRYAAILLAFTPDGYYHLTGRKHHISQELFSRMLRRRHIRKGIRYGSGQANDPAFEKYREIAKISYFGLPNTLKRMEKEMDRTTSYSHYFVHPACLEITCPGVSKGAALKQVMEMEGLSSENIAAFGDGENDIPMLDLAAIRVVPENAMKETKKHATHIVPSCSQDSIAKWIRANILISQ
ncbi:MAG: Cof-type HAD-IIB family hydrolase [Solobacterium sp.]|nr:Cof-type HAD-IIB family hydrolase [Solobacterium sp.]